MGKPKETKVLLVLGLQNSLCKDPRFSEIKAKIIKHVRRYMLDSMSHHRKKRHVRFLENPNLQDPDFPDDLLNIFGKSPMKRKDAYAKIHAAQISCATPDPFLETKLKEHMTFLTRRNPFTVEICGFGYDRIWFTAMACAVRNIPVTILSDMVGSWWAYEFQEEDKRFNRFINIKESGSQAKSLERKPDEDTSRADRTRSQSKQKRDANRPPRRNKGHRK